MKHCVTALGIAALLLPILAGADRIAVDIGRGINNMDGTDALFLRYAGDFDTSVFPGQNFYEGSLGMWDGNARNKGAGVALGTRWHFEQFHIEGSVGVAYLEDKTKLSGTHQQFSARLGIGTAYKQAEIGVYLTHYSNAKPLFGWDGPNAGYDFVTLQLAFPLK